MLAVAKRQKMKEIKRRILKAWPKIDPRFKYRGKNNDGVNALSHGKWKKLKMALVCEDPFTK